MSIFLDGAKKAMIFPFVNWGNNTQGIYIVSLSKEGDDLLYTCNGPDA